MVSILKVLWVPLWANWSMKSAAIYFKSLRLTLLFSTTSSWPITWEVWRQSGSWREQTPPLEASDAWSGQTILPSLFTLCWMGESRLSTRLCQFEFCEMHSNEFEIYRIRNCCQEILPKMVCPESQGPVYLKLKLIRTLVFMDIRQRISSWFQSDSTVVNNDENQITYVQRLACLELECRSTCRPNICFRMPIPVDVIYQWPLQ